MHLYRYGYFSASSSCSRRSKTQDPMGSVRQHGQVRTFIARPRCLLLLPHHIQVKTGDSISCTSLSIWIKMLTVMSSSPLVEKLVSTDLVTAVVEANLW